MTAQELFEAWFAQGPGDGKKPHRDDSGHGYFYQTTQAMWDGWAASRSAALEEAARIAENAPVQADRIGGRTIAKSIAAAIRAIGGGKP